MKHGLCLHLQTKKTAKIKKDSTDKQIHILVIYAFISFFFFTQTEKLKINFESHFITSNLRLFKFNSDNIRKVV